MKWNERIKAENYHKKQSNDGNVGFILFAMPRSIWCDSWKIASA